MTTSPRYLVLFLATLTTTACGGAGWEPQSPAAAQGSESAQTEADELPPNRSDAQVAIDQFLEADPELKRFFDEAHGFAIFPTVGKGGVGIGGAYGKGRVFEQGQLAGGCSLSQVSAGFQLGGQAYSEIIFFADKDALDAFKSGDFELGAGASAVAVTAGASADAAYDGGVAIFTATKGGLMYEATVAGQKFSYTAVGEADE